MNKDQALEELARVESRVAELRRIIEAPEKPEGLWRPAGAPQFYSVKGDGRLTWYDPINDHTLAAYALHGNVFPSLSVAGKAAPLMARANKIIAAALQCDPDAGPRNDDGREHTVFQHDDGSWSPHCEGWPALAVIFVHSNQQAEEMARILNAEDVK